MMKRLLKVLLDTLRWDKKEATGLTGLPLSAQNYIDQRLRDALERIDSETERKLREIVKDRFRIWDEFRTWLALIGMVATILTLLWGKEYLKKTAAQTTR